SLCCFFFQAEDGIRAFHVTGVQTCALPISWLESLCREAHLEGRKCSGCTCRPARRRAGRVAAFHARAVGLPRRPPIMGVLFPGRSEERRVGKGGRTRTSPDRGTQTGKDTIR